MPEIADLMGNVTFWQSFLEFFHAGVGDTRGNAEERFQPFWRLQMHQGGIADLCSRQAQSFERLHSFQVANAAIINLRIGEKQLLERRQVLEMHQARRGYAGPGQIEFLDMVESFEVTHVVISDSPLTKD
jgi:hypothetical protein